MNRSRIRPGRRLIYLQVGYDCCECYASIIGLWSSLGSSNILLCRMLYRVLGREVDDYRAFFSCTPETKDMISRYFGLHESFFSERANIKTCAYRYAKDIGANAILRGLLFRLRPRYQCPCQYAILYDHRSAMTEALIIVGDHSTFDADILSALYQARSCDLHPLLLCSIVSGALLKTNLGGIERYADKISMLTKLTGQHEYSYVPYSDPLETDFITTTRSLNFANKKIADEARIVTSILRSLEVIQKFSDEIVLDLSKTDNQLISLVFKDIVEYHVESCRDLLSTCEYVEKRIATLIQVVYQFMTQKDAKTNIALVESSAAIAKAAKADSSAMKTIAVLGMFFLPGAFVAAIFAMPVFDWDDNGRPSVKPAFKYYWAITAPLTLSVFLSWALAMVLPWHRWGFKLSGKKMGKGDIELPSR
ncbi:hypothetical protein DL98DRAFT_516380 [Cadophora sp. DSE1049]|nr:hypothetical protein DL98DRAFT_516380 [Cadophora sp. DSE1049]